MQKIINFFTELNIEKLSTANFKKIILNYIKNIDIRIA